MGTPDNPGEAPGRSLRGWGHSAPLWEPSSGLCRPLPEPGKDRILGSGSRGGKAPSIGREALFGFEPPPPEGFMKGGGEREGEGALPLPLIYLLPCGQSWCHRVFAHPVFTSLNLFVLSKPPPSGLLCLNHLDGPSSRKSFWFLHPLPLHREGQVHLILCCVPSTPQGRAHRRQGPPKR